MLNNYYLLKAIGPPENDPVAHGKPRIKEPSSYVLPERLPSTNIFLREAYASLEQAHLHQLRHYVDDEPYNDDEPLLLQAVGSRPFQKRYGTVDYLFR
ncbi:hypothetical protein FS842_000199 [Serendipita sp. 407]|nr:hypothetical protein FS842_000199 [Serendipita sp. 407]